MKNLIFATLITLITTSLFGQSEKIAESNIKDVTVYQQGAQISRISESSLLKGKTTLVFNGLSSKIDPKTIQATATNDIMIVSVTHSIDYLNKNTSSKEITKLEENRKSILDSLKTLKNLKSVYSQEKDMILSNKSIGGDNGVNISDLQNAASFFRNRLSEIETKSHNIDKKIYLLKTDLVDIAKQLLELNSQLDLPTSQIKIVVSSTKTINSKIKLNYIIADAGWIPNYDIRIKDTDSPLNLSYKAKVFQNTGEDWNDVNLTLSTGNPSITNNKPNLDTYYLTFNNYYSKSTNRTNNQKFNGVVHGKITSNEDGGSIPGANVIVKGTTIGVCTDIDGNYTIKLPSDNNILVFSALGYEDTEVTVNSSTLNASLKSSNLAMDEVVVVAYGISNDYEEEEMSVNSRLQGQVAGVNINKTKELIPLSIQKRQTSTEFKIDLPYSIPTDNKEYDVSMVEYKVPVQYDYSAVPKLSDDAYLVAKLTDWNKYNLLNGNANLFFKGIFQGETYLDLKSFDDTLAVSIGRDKDIIIEREIQKNFVSKSFTGSYKKELRAWDLTIKNNKENSIKISIEDQFPISRTDDIKVELLEQSGAKLDEVTGKLTWDLELAPNEKKVLTIKYSVRYPKNRKLIIE